MSKKKYHTSDEIEKEICLLEQMFHQTRSNYPYIDEHYIGKTPILRFNVGNNIVYINYERPITKEFRDLNNKIAHFHNQNFIIRLFSVLNNYQIFQNLKISDSPELYVLKLLKNIYCHSSGTYDKENIDHRNLMKRMIKTFNLEDKLYDDFPISIDTVINQIIKASINYIKGHYPEV
jgi:hypothetical protein